MTTFWEIVLILFLVLLNGAFALSELAIISTRKVRMQQIMDEGDKRASVVLKLLENPNRFLSTIQVGITLIGVFSGALGGATLSGKLNEILKQIPAIAHISPELSLLLIVIPISYFSLVIGELIPKRVALSNPEGLSLVMARPMLILSLLMRPIVWFLSASTEIGVKILGASSSKQPLVTEEEIRVMLEQGTLTGILEEAEQDIVESVFRFADRTVDALMTSRMDIIWLDIDQPFEELLNTVIESHHTIFPVAQGNLDDVVGTLSVKNLLKAIKSEETIDIRSLLEQPFFAPESMPALKVLEEIKRSGVSVALVIDEFGGILGMVTPQDILTAFVGDIPELGMEGKSQARQRDDGSWLFDGLLRVDEMKELLELDELPDEERLGYQTVGGMLMSILGRIPEAGQYFEWRNYKFEVVDMDGHRVDKILVSVTQKDLFTSNNNIFISNP